MLHNHSSQQLGTECEVVNDLRIGMARLQQRLNSMLEQCMDMQVELQRSVRQEVSSALNRSILTRDESKGNMLYDGSEWNFARKGICCVCRDSKTDSLLYRCGHMCTCSKCAEILVQENVQCANKLVMVALICSLWIWSVLWDAEKRVPMPYLRRKAKI